MLKTGGHSIINTEECLTNFVSRVNDAYVMSHTIYDLVNDSVYRKMTINNGKVAGTPLGSHHILPGYWFTVFVAPQEALKRVFEAIQNEQELVKKMEGKDSLVTEAFDKFKSEAGVEEMFVLLQTFNTKVEAMAYPLSKLEGIDTFPNKNILKRLCQSISSGNYTFKIENDLMCTFCDEDSLCGYQFKVQFNVADFTQFAIDFAKQMVELLRPIVAKHKNIKEEVSKLLIGDVFMEN
uniref:Uncharacterized protein n=1 Tax=Clytia hemisphaerica TaxID=252671 RepID=A0A7M6DR34_9CNID